MTETAIPPTSPAAQSADEDLSAQVRATPLAALLAQAAAPPKLQVYFGVLTPGMLDAPQAQLAPPQGEILPIAKKFMRANSERLAPPQVVHDLGWMRRVAVTGEDRFRWLSGMVTNTVSDLGANAGAWNLVLNAQGRIQGDLHVWREGGNLELEIAADQYDRLLAHRERFIIMDDVELKPLSEESALGLAGPLAGGVLEALGLPALAELLTSARAAWNGLEVRVVRAYGVLMPHYELWVKTTEIPALWKALLEAGATAIGVADLEALRIAEGIPAYGIDIAERDLPQEAVPQVQQAISFNKGCYQGQEIVERIRSRGSVHRHLRPLEIFGPLPAAGSALTLDGGAAAGVITSAAELPLATGSRSFALGMIRGEAEMRKVSKSASQPVSESATQQYQSFNYTAGAATGTARILTAPPKLEDG
jgi:folate-binding protein YgfZ